MNKLSRHTKQWLLIILFPHVITILFIGIDIVYFWLLGLVGLLLSIPYMFNNVTDLILVVTSVISLFLGVAIGWRKREKIWGKFLLSICLYVWIWINYLSFDKYYQF